MPPMLTPLVIRKIVLPVLFSCFFCFAKAGDLYGGELTYAKTSDFAFHFKLTLYLNSTQNPGWDSALVLFGDGTSDMLIKSSEVFIDSAHVWKIDLEGDHTYPGIGTYVVGFSAPNRPSHIVNVNGGNSVNEPFYIEDTLFIHDPVLLPFDHIISFPHLQTEVNYDGVTLTHNAQVSNSDVDSITYQLVVPGKGNIEYSTLHIQSSYFFIVHGYYGLLGILREKSFSLWSVLNPEV